MSTNFPTSIDTLTNPTASDDTSTVDHAAQHANANDAIEALEAKVGADSSAVTSSLDYKVSNAASINPGHKHTTAGLSITGTPDGTKFLKDDGSWSTPPTTTVATTSVTGTVKVSTTPSGDATAVETGDPRVPTQNENDALVGTSGTAVSSSNKLVDAADVSAAAASGKIVRATGTALPALSAANLTNLPISGAHGSTTKDLSDASTTQNIAHGLGKTPKMFTVFSATSTTNSSVIHGMALSLSGSSMSILRETTSSGSTGTTTTFQIPDITVNNASHYQTAVVTADSTNIILTWTKTGSPTGTVDIIWHALA